jgi:hypothetical protein
VGKRNALDIEPLEIERWLKALKREEGLENLTLDKIRRVMSLIYKHGQRYGLIPRTQEANPMRFVRCKTTSNYEAMILTPRQFNGAKENRVTTGVTTVLKSAYFGLSVLQGNR